MRAEYSEPWSFDSGDAESSAAMLHPGAVRVILFHVVARGRCFVALEDGEPHWAENGDVIVLPYGDHHTMGGVEPSEIVDIDELMPPLPWSELPVIRHGQGGDHTDVVCGYLHSEDPLFDPALRALPPVFVVRPEGAAADWVDASIKFALAGGPEPAPVRISELLLLEVLRLHLATAPAVERGRVAALHDPVLAPAMAALHADPSRKWTVPELAAAVSVSRSVLDDRFRSVLGRSPIRYLTEWRMHIADELLATTTVSIATIARRVGYESEEAFSRAFERAEAPHPLPGAPTAS